MSAFRAKKSNGIPVKPGGLLLALFRHGPAVERDDARYPDDDARPITPAGRKRVMAAARGLRRLGFIPDQVLFSPALRTRETAELIAKTLRLSSDVLKMEPALHGDADPGVLVRKTLRSARPGRALWVGHEPGLGEAAGLFAGVPAIPLRKAGMTVVEITPGKHGKAVLRAVLPPEWLIAAG